MELEIRSTPVTTSGEVNFDIPIGGRIAFWLQDPTYILGMEGAHYNFNLPVSDFIDFAQVRLLPPLQEYRSPPDFASYW